MKLVKMPVERLSPLPSFIASMVASMPATQSSIWMKSASDGHYPRPSWKGRYGTRSRACKCSGTDKHRPGLRRNLKTGDRRQTLSHAVHKRGEPSIRRGALPSHTSDPAFQYPSRTRSYLPSEARIDRAFGA